MRRITIIGCCVALAILGLSAASPSAQASLMGSLITGTLNGLDDTDADVGVRFDGTKYVLAPSALADGDFLVAGVSIDKIDRIGVDTVDVSGVNAFTILKISGDPTDAGTSPTLSIPLSHFVFEAPTVTEWAGIVDDLFGGAAALKKTTAGGLIMFFENATKDFDREAPPATLPLSADTIYTGGSVVGELGFTGAVDADGNVTDNATGEGWEAIGPNDPSSAKLITLNGGILGTSFSTAVTKLSGFGNLSFLPLPSVFDSGSAEFVGGGTLTGYGNGLGSPVGPWHIGSDADLSCYPVPEPATILIWSFLALVGTGLTVWRRDRPASRQHLVQ
jgi:hypothetical protein